MKNVLFTFIAAVAVAFSSFGQAPEGFKYQAVVRDASNLILANQPVGVQLTIQQGSIGGTAVYTETFSVTTNAFGLVNLEIGSGTTSDDFSLIDWANGPFFIETAIDNTGGTSYAVLGTSQLMSVPYALYAKSAGNTPTMTSELTNDSGFITSPDDADADATNELQALSISNDTLYLSSGGFVFLGDYAIDLVDDADADATNELQALSISNDTLYLSSGGFVFLGDYAIDLVDDADADATNELQALSISNDSLYLSSGGFVFLGDYAIDLVDDADADATNELQALSISNDTLYLSSGGSVYLGDYAIDLVDDADADATNELQTITRVGTTVTLSNGGGNFQDSVGVYTAGTGIDITNNVVSTSEPTYTIGLYPELGGYVIWVSADGKHGLVAETSGQGLSDWYGAQNFVSRPALHSTNGQRFRDWRLPTRWEMGEIYALQASIGSFYNTYYWTSTESDSTNAIALNFGNNQYVALSKDLYVGEVISVREF